MKLTGELLQPSALDEHQWLPTQSLALCTGGFHFFSCPSWWPFITIFVHIVAGSWLYAIKLCDWNLGHFLDWCAAVMLNDSVRHMGQHVIDMYGLETIVLSQFNSLVLVWGSLSLTLTTTVYDNFRQLFTHAQKWWKQANKTAVIQTQCFLRPVLHNIKACDHWYLTTKWLSAWVSPCSTNPNLNSLRIKPVCFRQSYWANK